MKPNRDANELAARLTSAASQAVPLPKPQMEATEKKTASRQGGNKRTVGISLRPSQALLNRYILEAAKRTQKTGRVVSAQQIMLEVLEKGL
jgi:hypothetical protein